MGKSAPKLPDVKELAQRLRHDFPALKFRTGKQFYWSPATQEVFYPSSASGFNDVLSLLHETGHALLGHKRYSLDFELLEMEVDAWQRARQLAADYGIAVDDDRIQDCLDTYREWIYQRSICPSCTTKALQLDDYDAGPAYRCYNCQTTWAVSPSRFCRPYRKLRGAQAARQFAFI